MMLIIIMLIITMIIIMMVIIVIVMGIMTGLARFLEFRIQVSVSSCQLAALGPWPFQTLGPRQRLFRV